MKLLNLEILVAVACCSAMAVAATGPAGAPSAPGPVANPALPATGNTTGATMGAIPGQLAPPSNPHGYVPPGTTTSYNPGVNGFSPGATPVLPNGSIQSGQSGTPVPYNNNSF